MTRRCWVIMYTPFPPLTPSSPPTKLYLPILSQSAYTAALIISSDLAIRRGRPTIETEFKQSISHTEHCIEALQYCSVFDPVAQSYLQVLQPLHDTLSTPEPSVRTRRLRNHAAMSFPSTEELVEHVVELIRTPFGGESVVVDNEYFAGNVDWPEGYRFLYRLSAPGEAGKLRIPTTGVVGVAREVGERKYPHRSKEEWEAFFRRTT